MPRLGWTRPAPSGKMDVARHLMVRNPPPEFLDRADLLRQTRTRGSEGTSPKSRRRRFLCRRRFDV